MKRNPRLWVITRNDPPHGHSQRSFRQLTETAKSSDSVIALGAGTRRFESCSLAIVKDSQVVRHRQPILPAFAASVI